jgi:predicted nucleotidyltransferase
MTTTILQQLAAIEAGANPAPSGATPSTGAIASGATATSGGPTPSAEPALSTREGVRILYACESGSRAWGFASPDSDYDVRFIYAQPRNRYLSIRERKDIIELPVDALLDINGWDIRKALQLFLKSNSPLYEWLQSPIVYMDPGDAKPDSPGPSGKPHNSGTNSPVDSFAADLRRLMPHYYSRRAGCHHYLSMAYNAFTNDLRADEVRLKKYFYALRPTLACGWILEKGTVPPMEFPILRTLITDSGWNDTVDDLLRRKSQADEKALIPPVPLLQDWLVATLAQYKDRAEAIPAVKHDTEELDILFRKYVDRP